MKRIYSFILSVWGDTKFTGIASVTYCVIISVLAFEDPNSLSHKKSELRLYCDLMMQQVHAVKSAATVEAVPDVQVILLNNFARSAVKHQ